MNFADWLEALDVRGYDFVVMTETEYIFKRRDDQRPKFYSFTRVGELPIATPRDYLQEIVDAVKKLPPEDLSIEIPNF